MTSLSPLPVFQQKLHLHFYAIRSDVPGSEANLEVLQYPGEGRKIQIRWSRNLLFFLISGSEGEERKKFQLPPILPSSQTIKVTETITESIFFLLPTFLSG